MKLLLLIHNFSLKFSKFTRIYFCNIIDITNICSSTNINKSESENYEIDTITIKSTIN